MSKNKYGDFFQLLDEPHCGESVDVQRILDALDSSVDSELEHDLKKLIPKIFEIISVNKQKLERDSCERQPVSSDVMDSLEAAAGTITSGFGESVVKLVDAVIERHPYPDFILIVLQAWGNDPQKFWNWYLSQSNNFQYLTHENPVYLDTYNDLYQKNRSKYILDSIGHSQLRTLCLILLNNELIDLLYGRGSCESIISFFEQVACSSSIYGFVNDYLDSLNKNIASGKVYSRRLPVLNKRDCFSNINTLKDRLEIIKNNLNDRTSAELGMASAIEIKQVNYAANEQLLQEKALSQPSFAESIMSHHIKNDFVKQLWREKCGFNSSIIHVIKEYLKNVRSEKNVLENVLSKIFDEFSVQLIYTPGLIDNETLAKWIQLDHLLDILNDVSPSSLTELHNLSGRIRIGELSENHPLVRLYQVLAQYAYPDDSEEIIRLMQWERDELNSYQNFIFSCYDDSHSKVRELVNAPVMEGEFESQKYRYDFEKSKSLVFPDLCPNDQGLQELARCIGDGFKDLKVEYGCFKSVGLPDEISTLTYIDEFMSELFKIVKDEATSPIVRVQLCRELYSLNNLKKDGWLLSSSDRRMLENYYLNELEQCADYSSELYLAYIDKLHWNVSEKERVRRSLKCLSLIKRCIDIPNVKWRLANYWGCLDSLLKAGEHAKLLVVLLQIYKKLPVESFESAVKINWRMNAYPNSSDSNEQGVNGILTQRLYPSVSSNDQTITKMYELNEALCMFCINGLKLKKGEKVSGTAYEPHQCKEKNTHWRRGMLSVLAELRLDPKKSAHRVAHFVANNDFDDDTRKLAQKVHDRLCKNSINGSFDSGRDRSVLLSRNYLAALWWLRLARVDASEDKIDIDIRLAKRWRRRELRYVV